LIALLATALACPQSPPLVPPTPPDWQGERIEFPLDFAPDIALEGVEELRFAPGMFQPGSETHWTYIFGLDVRAPEGGELDVDAAFVEDFLLRYYRGLCGAVAGSKGLAIDLEAIAAEVTGGGASFQATIELFDAFADGAPLDLAFELLVHPKAEGVEMLGLAAPDGASEEVRAELTALGQAWRDARPVPIFLNHVYVIPDLATYEALAASELLRELGPVEERTTRRGDLEYTGLYLYGERTYLEFLKPDPSMGFAPGGSGIAFGVELPGGLARVAPALQAEGIGTFPGKITREFRGQQVPWFEVLGFEAATTTQRLQLFAMEYDPEFLQRWHPPALPEPTRIDHEAVLGRTVDVLGHGQDAAFRDLAFVHVRLEAGEFERYGQIASAIGLQEDLGGCRSGSEPVKPWSGTNFKTFATGGRSGPGGVEWVHLELRRPLESREVDFGQVELEIVGPVVRFTFDGLPPEEDR
jgi:hypothetical protein